MRRASLWSVIDLTSFPTCRVAVQIPRHQCTYLCYAGYRRRLKQFLEHLIAIRPVMRTLRFALDIDDPADGYRGLLSELIQVHCDICLAGCTSWFWTFQIWCWFDFWFLRYVYVFFGWAAGRASGLYKTEWWGAGMVICLEQGADLHMAQLMPLPLTVSCFSEIQIGFTFLVPAYPGSPGKRAVKCVCVCVCVLVYFACFPYLSFPWE